MMEKEEGKRRSRTTAERMEQRKERMEHGQGEGAKHEKERGEEETEARRGREMGTGERERKERKNNIVIKGVEDQRDWSRKWKSI